MFAKIVSPIVLKSKTIPILIILFAIKIVASNFLGLFRSLTTIVPVAVFSSPISLRSVAESPKKATSAPEISAEQQSKTISTMVLIANTPSKWTVDKSKLRGSGSNSYNLICLEW